MRWVTNCGEYPRDQVAIEYFGPRQDNGTANLLPPTYFLGRQRPKDLDPALHECRHMRYIACNEIPEHDYFAFDALKPLVEQQGSGVMTRTIYERPEQWMPMGGVYLSSNHELRKTRQQSQDSGTRRRYNVVRHRHVFQGGANIKDDIMKGLYNGELFWL